jgi:hypothetical protein
MAESLLLRRLLVELRDLHASSRVLSEDEKSNGLSAFEIVFSDAYSLQNGIIERSIGVAIGFGLLEIFVIFERVLFVRKVIALRIAYCSSPLILHVTI